MKSYLPVFFVLLLFFSCNKPAQLIRPEGIYVAGVTDPMVKLNGIWEIDTKPEAEFWEQGNASGDWEEVQVPGEVMMQGFYIESNEPFAYRKAIDIPGDYAGKKIYLQFDGVYGYARLWVNGNFIREHHGGFTRWKGDITPHVKPGEQATIVLEVTDRTDDISYASGYAKHQIGGILRDVTLLALPQHHLDHFEVRTEMDETYENAVLTVSGTLISDHPNAKVSLELWDKKDGTVSMENGSTAIGADASFTIRNTIIHPEKWDAEHPNLYTLSIALHEDGELIWSKKEKIGFREVQVDGNRFLVNGQPVKLRGACRHDVHPELGRVSTPEYELQDVLLAKEANMNYIRTSHYPPSENFLKLCDEYGLYVEEETAVCFIINYRIPGYEEAAKSHSDPAYTSRYLSQLEEMVVDHRNHPSVVIWSIGNESTYGPNFQKSYDWIKENDPTRPVMLSYPGSTPDSLPQPYNILSMHYPPVSGDLTQFGLTTEAFGYEAMPVIFDEWAHVPCYNNATIKEDPNIRDFWGRSLDSMWIRTFAASGGLGGAIWGMIDETFMLPAELEGLGQTWGRTGKNDATIVGYEGPAVGYGEWGIIDTWRRKKPEFWNTKKAYSPIRIMQTQLTGYQAGDPIRIPVYNRFDHTNLSEVKTTYTYKGNTNTLSGLAVAPHETGELVLPIGAWESSEAIEVSFHNRENDLIDSYSITRKNAPLLPPKVTDGEVDLHEEEDTWRISTERGDFLINKETGLLTSVLEEDNKFTVSGPHLVYKTKGKQLTYSSNEINVYGGEWKLIKLDIETTDGTAIIKIQGRDGVIGVNYQLEIYSDATLTTSYSFQELPRENVRELGVKYRLDGAYDRLSWHRQSYWSTYPDGHLSAATGETALYPEKLNTYREKPSKPWVMDTKSFYYNGIDGEQKDELTHIARSAKEAVYEYTLFQANGKRLTVFGQGDIDCRLNKTGGQLELYLDNLMDYIDLNWGNHQKNIMLDGAYQNRSTMKFEAGHIEKQ